MRTAALPLCRRTLGIQQTISRTRYPRLSSSLFANRAIVRYSSQLLSVRPKVSNDRDPENGARFDSRSRNKQVYQYNVNEKTGQARFEKQFAPDNDLHVPLGIANEPAAWARLFDRYLPEQLRETHNETIRSEINSREQLREIATILNFARDASENLLAWMITNGYNKAATHIIESILKNVAGRAASSVPRIPSNISWPSQSLDTLCNDPIEIESLSYLSTAGIEALVTNEDGEHLSTLDNRFLSHIWSLLGDLVIQSADQDESKMKETLSTVMLLLGKIHNLGLMPEDIYSYAASPYSSMLAKPPILHLLSSRILTSLSDAVWRYQSDEMIDQAVRLGRGYKDIGLDPPGGRFRLKVRSLGPEIWLEMILWGCIEGGYGSAAMKIVKKLKNKAENPWFAIRWNPSDSSHQPTAKVDWERVKSRHGGPVGLIEGYSRESPFVEIPSRTISLEVMTALIDLLLNSVDPGVSDTQMFNSMGSTQNDIATVMEFLEPHDLPAEYLDYVTTRLVQNGGFDMEHSPLILRRWCNTVTKLTNLATLQEKQTPSPNLSLKSINAYSEFFAGIQHQALDGLIYNGDFHQSLEVFNEIQKAVDMSKLSAIQAFLHTPRVSDEFFSSRPFHSRLEYVGSHGQIPYYKLGGFLNLISDTNMPGLGRWLLYAEDVDGAVIPHSAYGTPSLFAPLVRFAATSEDEELLGQVISARSRSSLKPSVRMQRALVNCHIDFLDFAGAEVQLKTLSAAKAGAYSFDNLAHLGAVILRLESQLYQLDPFQTRDFTARARDLLYKILGGQYNSPRDDFTRTQRILFGQQMSHMLRLFGECSGSQLEKVAQEWIHKFPVGNAIDLPTPSFNTVLSAIVDTRGARYGMAIWQRFCKPAQFAREDLYTGDEDEILTLKERQDRSYKADSTSWAGDFQDQSQASYLPFAGENNDSLTANLESLISDVSHQANTPMNGSEFQSEEPIPLQDFEATDVGQMTVPDLRTIRLIVRSAVDAKARLLSQQFSVREQDQVLQWSVKAFHEFFDAPKALIQQEIQEPLTDDELRYYYRTEWPELDNRSFGNIEHGRRIPRQGNLRLRSAFQGRHITQYPNEVKVRAVLEK